MISSSKRINTNEICQKTQFGGLNDKRFYFHDGFATFWTFFPRKI